MADFSIEPVSEDALLLRFGTGVDAGTNARVQAAARALRAASIAGLIDIAPAYATLLLRFATVSDMAEMGSGSFSAATVLHGVDAEGNEPDPTSVESENESGPTSAVDIPVCYGGDYGADLAAVAAHARLDPEAVVARHTATPYKVAMLGFAPGFPYLLGLDPALQVPRRASPRTRVPAGSVAIGAAQTGIYPRELPGGWQLIGRTPLTLFAPARDPPSLLAPGDRVRFHAIDADTFTRLAERRA